MAQGPGGWVAKLIPARSAEPRKLHLALQNTLPEKREAKVLTALFLRHLR